MEPLSKPEQTSFKKILIANRGEIACRVIRTAQKLGYETIAVFSEADRHARHVQMADSAIAIGGKTATESYLCEKKIIAACTKGGAQAVHPGYGFLSENADFAQACENNGLVFIGPAAEAIRAMGNKSQAKALVAAAGVPCIPGYHGQMQELDLLRERGCELGFPLMVKAAAGGGGRGLRLVQAKEQLSDLLQSARTEAQVAFGSGELLLERALSGARHIEVQVFGDRQGNIIHLGERDCSIQRRHQKVFEESPSPIVSDKLRQEMGETAVRAAAAINYVGAGTVEFLLDEDGHYYFLEMNTRLQVEHAVTELITGIDLVEWQFLVAAGHPLPLRQEQIHFSGHAIEARLCAEDPDDDFRPQAGTIVCFRPAPAALARTDHGLAEGGVSEISPYYDSLLAKVICHGPHRDAAIRMMERALESTVVLGVKTNREFLLHSLKEPKFLAGQADTSFIAQTWQPRRKAGEETEAASPDQDAVAMAAAILLFTEPMSKNELFGWSNTGQMCSAMRLSVDGEYIVDLELMMIDRNAWRIRPSGATTAESDRTVSIERIEQEYAQVMIDKQLRKAMFVRQDRQLHLSLGGNTHIVCDQLFQPRAPLSTVCDGDVLAPSHGLLASLQIRAGEIVQKGQPVFTVESMKLIQTVYAPVTGAVTAVLADAGQQVKARQLIARIEPVS